MKGLKHVISISNYKISRNQFQAEHHVLQPSCFYTFYQDVIPFSVGQRKQALLLSTQKAKGCQGPEKYYLNVIPFVTGQSIM